MASRGLINYETGEVIDISDDKRISIYSQIDIERKKLNKKLFFKLFKDTLPIFSDKNNSPVIRTFFKLIELMRFENEYLSKDGLPLNLKNISELCDIKIPTLKIHINKLEKLEVLKKIKNGRDSNIMINPYFISLGTKYTDKALETFSKSKWAKNLKI